MQYFKSKYVLPRGTALNVIGDSQLIINFLNRKCTPGDKFFVSVIDKVRTIGRQLQGQVRYYHVNR